MPNFGRMLIVAMIALIASVGVQADTLTVAVASNFSEALRDIAAKFTQQTGHEVLVSPGSSGKLYAQIVNGAPYDIFLSADAHRPKLLEQESMIIAGSRFTYAIGQLLLWSRDQDLASGACNDRLQNLGQKKLAIANPLLAPYGLAAKQYLVASGLWDKVQENLVYGENIAQTFQYAVSGNASIAMISPSQLGKVKDVAAVCAVPVPAGAHDEILQQAVQLARSLKPNAAGEFLSFLRGSESRAIIRKHGYLLPEPQ